MDKIHQLLECLIEEIKKNKKPSEHTLFILMKYEKDYDIVKEYFKEINE